MLFILFTPHKGSCSIAHLHLGFWFCWQLLPVPCNHLCNIEYLSNRTSPAACFRGRGTSGVGRGPRGAGASRLRGRPSTSTPSCTTLCTGVRHDVVAALRGIWRKGPGSVLLLLLLRVSNSSPSLSPDGCSSRASCPWLPARDIHTEKAVFFQHLLLSHLATSSPNTSIQELSDATNTA
jgi:hypothetical protein